MKFWLEIFRRFAFVSSVVLWLGGFTFYAGIVVPVGARVLHSHMKQGLITQQVTGWLNLIGILALLIIFWNVLATERTGRWSFRLAIITWIGMAIAQVFLFLLHPVMDRLIDIKRAAILDDDRFDTLHAMYGAISTAQWGLGVLHVVVILWIWTVAGGHGRQFNPVFSASDQ